MGFFSSQMASERTFIAIKPDGVQRNLVGEIISRFERKGFQLVGMKFIAVPKELAEEHYAEHKERPFFGGLIDFITSGPVVAGARSMIGATAPSASAPGTIRGDFGLTVGRNIIHGSDAVETAQREIALWFKDDELASWTARSTPDLYE